MNNKPFDLQKALAGEPVITRSGKKIVDIYHFKYSGSTFSVLATIEGSNSEACYTVDGKYHLLDAEHKNDLFMAPEKKTVWVNISKYPDMGFKAYVHETPGSADEGSRSFQTGEPSDDFIGTYPIEIEL